MVFLLGAALQALQRAARAVGLPEGRFKSHSLRIGGVTDAKAAGVTADEVKRMGRWDSEAHAIYDRGDLGVSMSKMLTIITGSALPAPSVWI